MSDFEDVRSDDGGSAENEGVNEVVFEIRNVKLGNEGDRVGIVGVSLTDVLLDGVGVGGLGVALRVG